MHAGVNPDAAQVCVRAGGLKLTATDAARAAGYADTGSACRVRGHELIHDPRVQSAVEEVVRAHIGTEGVTLALNNLLAIARSPTHRRHYEASIALADRGGLGVKTEHKVTIQRTDDASMLDIARRFAAEMGVPLLKLIGSNTIEGITDADRAEYDAARAAGQITYEVLPEPEPAPKSNHGPQD